MRVTGGVAKGIPLSTRRGLTTRPTLGRVRETLFAILAPRLEGANFLDLFAGTGAVGIEALSRGAKYVIFVESNRTCVRLIKENLARTSLAQRAEVVAAECAAALRRLTSRGMTFDIVFCDPPYRQAEGREIFALTENVPGVLREGGLFILQRPRETPHASLASALRLQREVVIGSTVLSFYTRT